MLRNYYQLTKPGIIYGNIMTAIAGFLLAAGHYKRFSIASFVGLTVGLSLVIAAACVCNNYLDRSIDKKMQRTCRRALVTHAIGNRPALVFAGALLIIGVAIELWLTNVATIVISLLGFAVYVLAYTFGKRHSVHATVIGSFAGAAPIMAGYVAQAGRFDLGAWLVGLCLVFWQMPHFYAIALHRLDDYVAAKIPVLPAKRSLARTRGAIVGYIVLFIAATTSLSIAGYTGYCFFGLMLIVGLGWLLQSWRWRRLDASQWGKVMFRYSLLVILVFSLALPVGALVV